MVSKSEKVFLSSNILKTIALSVVVYHDAYDQPWVWFLLVQAIVSNLLWVFIHRNRNTTRTDLVRLVKPINMVLRVIAIWTMGHRWEYHNSLGASFAFVFVIVMIIEIGCAAFVGYFSTSMSHRRYDNDISSFMW